MAFIGINELTVLCDGLNIELKKTKNCVRNGFAIDKHGTFMCQIKNSNEPISIDYVNFIINNIDLIKTFYIRFYNGKRLALSNFKLVKRFVNIEKIIKLSDQEWSVSPSGSSFYDRPDEEIGWNYKPIGSLRISGHWNFTDKETGNIHCRLSNVNELSLDWVVARFNGTTYDIDDTLTELLNDNLDIN